ncbi:hypothetical protein ACROYT_G008165 [Oculina patagonica]
MKIYFPFLTAAFVFNIAVSRTIALNESYPSRPFLITRNHRRLKGFTFKTFHSSSQLSCTLQCQRNPRCVSSNFRKASSTDGTEGICELNEKQVLLPNEEKELEYDEETVYTQFYDMKHDCQLTGCMNAESCSFNEISKVFNCKPKRNCAELYKSGERISGVYSIDPDGSGAFDVFCDQTTAGGGWTVFQKRLDGSVDFYRDWTDYKSGFGNLNGEFWLGLDKIHRLTQSENGKLRVDLKDWEGDTRFAEYDSFAIGDEASKYSLSLGSYSGSASDSLSTIHNGKPFSTKDLDNDSSGGNCAVSYKGAWWYASCHHSNLNGLYHHGQHSSTADGVNWSHWKGYHYSLKQVGMKIRPVNF